METSQKRTVVSPEPLASCLEKGKGEGEGEEWGRGKGREGGGGGGGGGGEEEGVGVITRPVLRGYQRSYLPSGLKLTAMTDSVCPADNARIIHSYLFCTPYYISVTTLNLKKRSGSETSTDLECCWSTW